MKRTVACILMTVVILLSLLVPAGAESTDEGWITEPYRKSVVLWNADESWGGQFEVDAQNQVEGLGCASIDISVPEGKHSVQKSVAPVDATGMDTLEFDLYLSDADVINLLTQTLRIGDLEIASKNDTSQGALHIEIYWLFYQIKQAKPQAGWNHITLPLDQMKVYYGEIDYSCINHISMYWAKNGEIPQGTVIKFDNFIMTDRAATSVLLKEQETALEKQKADQLAEQYAELLAVIRQYYDACMELPEEYLSNPGLEASHLTQEYFQLREKYKAVPSADQKLLNRYFDCSSMLSRGVSYANRYERAKIEFPAIEDMVMQVLSISVYTDESLLTPENYQDVSATAEQLKAALKSLTSNQKKVMDEQGYTDIITIVNKTLTKHKHRYVQLPDMSSLAHAASCTKGAQYYKQCELCGALSEETFEQGEPTGHTPISDFPFSAGERGHGQMCRDCLVFVGVLDAHDFSEWKILSEATPTESGMRERKCQTCTYVQTQELTYVAPVVPDEPDEPSDSGCFAVLPGGAFLGIALIVPMAAVLRKKKK